MVEALTVAQSIQQLVVDKGPCKGSMISWSALILLHRQYTNTTNAVRAMKCLAQSKGFDGYEVVEIPEPDIKDKYMAALRGNEKEKPSPCGSCRFGPAAIIMPAPANKKRCLIIEAICSKD